MTNVAGTTNQHGYQLQSQRVPLLAMDKAPVGPVTRAKMRRALTVGAGVGLLAVVASLLAPLPWQRTLALGVLYPGGGFLGHLQGGPGAALGHLGLFVLTAVMFVLALVLWVATGNLLAVPTVWLATAGWAASMTHSADDQWGWATLLVSILAAATVLLLARLVRITHATAEARRDDINAHLVRSGGSTPLTPLRAGGLPEVHEMSAEALPLMRYLLDRALQPVEDFEGFDKLDEFREAAKRYQLTLSSYALSNQAYSHMPSFRGYLTEAQHRLGLKMQDHRVWSYWRKENLWGRMHADANPIAINNNIMWTGYYGAMLGLLATTGDDHSFTSAGGVELVSRRKTYTSSFTGLCENLHHNFRASDFTLFPCEPGWAYPICNGFGAIALITHDRLYGSSFWADVEEPYRRHLEDEFVTADGRITSIRHTATGISVALLNSTMPGCLAGYYLNAIFPDLARRTYEITRKDLVRLVDGELDISVKAWDLIDFGNYRLTKLSSYAVIASVAREQGDEEVAEKVLALMNATYPSQVVGGVRHYPLASVGAHSMIHQATNMRPNSMHDLVQVGMPRPWVTGPLLAAASYPDALVAKAVIDGAALARVGYPGQPQGGRTTLGLSQLRPSAVYRLDGAVDRQIVADPKGQATITVDLAGRTPVLVSPVG